MLPIRDGNFDLTEGGKGVNQKSGGGALHFGTVIFSPHT